jgi:hypothetical protein
MSFSAAALLGVWDRGQPLHGPDRALALLEAASAGSQNGDLASLRLDERDRLLAALHEEQFGPELPARTECPACHERLELSLRVSELWSRPQEPVPKGGHVDIGGQTISFRLPTTHDLRAIEGLDSLEEARATLVKRCIVEVSADGLPPESLPPETLEAVAAALSAGAGEADISIELTCPACHEQWLAELDIGAYLWTEIANEASRVLLQVHTLAQAYGWTESSILSLSAARREAYLALVGT